MAHALQLVNQYLYIITNQSLVGISVYLVLDRSMRFPAQCHVSPTAVSLRIDLLHGKILVLYPFIFPPLSRDP